MKKSRNQGFSLVELIVVIAIMAIVTAGAVAGISAMTGAKLNSCSSNLIAGLEQTKVNALSKSAAELTLTCDADGNYVMSKTGEADQTIGDNKIIITYQYKDSTGADINKTVSASDSLIISYRRGSGAFLPIIDSVDEADHSYIYVVDGAGMEMYCETITLTRGSRTKIIHLVKDTGKSYLE